MPNLSSSRYTVLVEQLVASITGNQGKEPSLYQDAENYFKQAPNDQEKLGDLERKVDTLFAALQDSPKSISTRKAAAYEQAKKKLKIERAVQRNQRLARLNRALSVCRNLLELTEGENFNTTQLKSSKFLATLVMFSPGQGKRLAELHQSLKPAYKAVLSLRLLDKMLTDGYVKNPYILAYYDQKHRYSLQPMDEMNFTQSVIIPVVLAAMFQDIGLLHPRLTKILEGEDGQLDRFRLLSKDERDQMLKLNYQYTLDYLTFGLGEQHADSVDEAQAEAFKQAEDRRLKWQSGLIENANSTKMGTSEVIKVPQIYASVVFSTKRDFSKASLPNGALLIKQLAVKHQISKLIADSFIRIVGHFPLGYGVVYIPSDIRGGEVGTYEYAIVTALNAPNPDEPICRLVSKNQIFMDYSTSEIIEKSRNLHFPSSRKKLEKIDPKRLQEILEKLTHGFKPEHMDELLPTSWDPYEYFCVSGNQNLWSKST